MVVSSQKNAFLTGRRERGTPKVSGESFHQPGKAAMAGTAAQKLTWRRVRGQRIRCGPLTAPQLYGTFRNQSSADPRSEHTWTFQPRLRQAFSKKSAAWRVLCRVGRRTAIRLNRFSNG